MLSVPAKTVKRISSMLPTAFIFENVPRLASKKYSHYFKKLLKRTVCGHNIMDARDYDDCCYSLRPSCHCNLLCRMNRSGRYIIRWKAANFRQPKFHIHPSIFCVRLLIAEILGYRSGDAACGSWDTRRPVPKAGP